MKRKIMIDTQVLDYIYDNNIDLLNYQDNFYITSVQFSEIKNINQISKINKKNYIISLFESWIFKQLPVKKYFWNDELFWDDKDLFLDNMSDNYCKIFKFNIRDREDAMIYESCKDNWINIIITSDKKFSKKIDWINIIAPENYFI